MRIRREYGAEGLEALVELESHEIDLLGNITGQYLSLIAADDGDPALERLFPAGYRDDAEAAAEFASLTRTGLRSRKERNAAFALESLEASPMRLGEAGMAHWLPFLTDLRLVLAERLGIRRDEDEIPDTPAGDIYEWLGHLQTLLIAAIDPDVR